MARRKAVREWHRITELVGYYVLTGYLKDEHAQSLLLVGEPGTGKSSIILRFRKAPKSKVVLDVTVEGIRRNLLPDIKKKGYRTLLMPEFYKPFQRQSVTAQNMVGLLTAVMSSEVDNILVGPEALQYSGVQAGVVGAMTSQVFTDWSTSLSAQGVLDRMSVLTFDLSQEERFTIEENILREDSSDIKPVKWPWPKQSKLVMWEPALRGDLRVIIDQILVEDRNRLTRQLISLCKAIALRDGKRRVMKKHVRRLASFMDFLKNIRPDRG